MRICFITDGEPFHGGSPEERALGGSETALVQIARALARRGHDVRVFCRCPAPGWYHGVIYRDRSELVRAALEQKWDVLVISRFFGALSLPLQAGVTVLWNHDILDRPGELAAQLAKIDLMLVLSRYHAADYAGKLPECADKIVLTRNGLDLDLLDRSTIGVTRQPGRMVYASRPERGLKLLLEYIWPALLRRRPDLHLTICGYSVVNTPIHPAITREYDEIDRLLKITPNVTTLGALAKGSYYAHLASCQAMLYPCVFPEISCIAALEAQAVGTPIITSDSFALSETVMTDQFRITGKPGSPEYVEAYVTAVDESLARPVRTAKLASKAREAVRARHGWDVIAGQWEMEFRQRLDARARSMPVSLAASLVLNGDRSAAATLLGRRLEQPREDPAPPPDPKETELIAEITAMIGKISASAKRLRLGVMAADAGRTAQTMERALPGVAVCAVDQWLPGGGLDVLLVRDVLEREADPDQKLKQLLEYCAPDGWILLCVASGAWPLIGPGHAARAHDLGEDDLRQLLADRPAQLRFVPQGLIKAAGQSYSAGRWLAMAPVQGAPPRAIDQRDRHCRVRPAPPEIEAEVIRAQLL